MISSGDTAPQKVGFEVDRTQPSPFLHLLYRSGFDERFTSLSGPSVEKKTKLDKAGQLWELCLRHESSVPEVISAAAVNADILKDQALIASVRATCCEVWLGAWEQGQGSDRLSGWEEGTSSAFLQIVEWVIQASDSLILCRQFSALWLLLERVDLGKVLEAADSITSADELADAGINVKARLRPVVLATKMLIYRAYASMQCKTATAALSSVGGSVNDARQYLDRVKGDVGKMYCDLECLSVAMRFVGLLLDVEDLDAAYELLKALSGIVQRLRERDEELGRAWEARMAVGLVWCGRVKNIEMGGTLADSLVELSLEGLRCLEDVEDLDPGLDARGEASIRLDAIVRANGADVAEALGKACATMVPRWRSMRLVLSTYAWTFQCSSRDDACSGGGTVAATGGIGATGAIDGRRAFLLSVLGNLCLRFDAAFASTCPGACEVISSLLSNRIVVRSLQVDIGLARDLHALLWNAACDADLEPTARVWLLSSAKAMADLTQDVGCIPNALLSLARMRSHMWHFDVACELANRAAQYDALGAAIVKLEIEAARSERATRVSRSETTAGAAEAAGPGGAQVEVSTVKELVTGIFSDDTAFSVYDGLDLVCRFMEAGDTLPRRIIGGVLLDRALRHAVSSSTPDLALIIFQNLITLARSTKHPILMESIHAWMEGEPAGLDIARLIVITRGAKPPCTDVDRYTIDGLRFAANQAASMAIDMLREGSPSRAQTAAMFASRILDTLYDVDLTGRGKHAISSQVCWILACNAACLADGDINPGTLVAGLEDRRSRIRSDSKTVNVLSFHAKLSALFIHIKTGSDLRASEALQEIRGMLPEVGPTTLRDVLGRLRPSMPHTLKQALEIALEVLTPDDPAYFEAIRALATMPSASKDDTVRLVGKVHRLLATVASEPSDTANSPFASFVEWFYMYAWNLGARTIALEGMELHNLLGHRQRALLANQDRFGERGREVSL
jgi:hypothetical protein